MKRALRAVAFAAFCLMVVVRPLDRHSASAGTALRMELEALSESADVIIEGRVIAEQARRDVHGFVRTRYTVSVSRTFAGVPLGTRTFEFPGGSMPDGSGTLVAGLPSLRLGEDALLFLCAEGPQQLRMPVGLAQGKFTLVRDEANALGLVRSQAELVLLDSQTGASAPFPAQTVLAYERVIERVQRAVAARQEGR